MQALITGRHRNGGWTYDNTCLTEPMPSTFRKHQGRSQTAAGEAYLSLPKSRAALKDSKLLPTLSEDGC